MVELVRANVHHVIEPGAGPAWPSRLTVFLPVFLAALAAGLIYTFARPAEYRGTASVRVTTQGPRAPVPATAPGVVVPAAPASASPSLVAEAQVLTSVPVLRSVLAELDADPARLVDPPTFGELQAMLQAAPSSGSDVLELAAEGTDRLLLQQVLEAWIDAYVRHRSASERETSTSTQGDLVRERESLERQIADKRAQLDRFRSEHDIVSLEREENEAAARLKQLTSSLAESKKKLVEAESRATAVRRDLASGRPVLRPTDKTLIASLQNQERQVRDQLREAEKVYTEKYMSADPRMKALRASLQDLQAQIAREQEQSARAVLTEAEQDVASLRDTVETLTRQLDGHKRKAVEFTARFAEHKALTGELDQIEAVYKSVQDSLVQGGLKQERRTPQVQVLAPPTVSQYPVRPDYLRDSLLSLGGALGLGLAAVLLLEFLRRRPDESVTAFPTVQIAVQGGGLLGGAVPPAAGAGLGGPATVPGISGADATAAVPRIAGGSGAAAAVPRIPDAGSPQGGAIHSVTSATTGQGDPGGARPRLGVGSLGGPGASDATVAGPTAPAPALPRELTAHEVEALWSAATEDGRLALAALLTGLSADELVALTWDDVSLARGTLTVGGRSQRVLPIPPALAGMLAPRWRSLAPADGRGLPGAARAEHGPDSAVAGRAASGDDVLGVSEPGLADPGRAAGGDDVPGVRGIRGEPTHGNAASVIREPILGVTADGVPLGVRDVEGLVACAAHDAGLDRAVEITPAVLRHTYIAYLVRQGARLAEIERLVGRLPPSAYADYGRLSPPGPGLPLSQVQTAYLDAT